VISLTDKRNFTEWRLKSDREKPLSFHQK